MGLLTLGLVLAGSVATMELYIVRNFRPSRFNPDAHSSYTRWVWRFVYKLGPWIEKSPVNGLIFSLGLSLAIGWAFPAMGVAVMLAGVVSTLLTQPVYMVVRKVQRIKARFLSTKP